MIKLGSVMLCALLMAGCVVTRTTQATTGLFDDDLKKLSVAYEKMDKMKRDGLTLKMVEEQTGIQFNAIKNVEDVGGPWAFRKIFGDATFQGAGANLNNLELLTREMQRFRAFFIPHRKITTHTDRFYFTTKDAIKEGDDLLIVVMFRDDKLFHTDYKYVKYGTKESTSAFAQGVEETLKDFLAPSNALLRKLREHPR